MGSLNSHSFKSTTPRKSTMPVYSKYAEMINLCDRFNRKLQKKGEPGNYHNFALSAVLQNIFNLYHAINDEDHTKISFCQFAVVQLTIFLDL